MYEFELSELEASLLEHLDGIAVGALTGYIISIIAKKIPEFGGVLTGAVLGEIISSFILGQDIFKIITPGKYALIQFIFGFSGKYLEAITYVLNFVIYEGPEFSSFEFAWITRDH